METLMQLLPVFVPYLRRLRWKVKKAVRGLKYALTDALVILIGTGAVLGVWYLGFVVWPKFANH